MSIPVEDLKRIMADKTDEGLYDVLYGHSNDYTSEAIEVAKQEFASRSLDEPTLSNLGNVAKEQKQIEEAGLEWPLRTVAFFVSTMFLFIPVLLAHRHYVEKGAKRKAHEWARWALYGFLFYFALSLLRLTL